MSGQAQPNALAMMEQFCATLAMDVAAVPFEYSHLVEAFRKSL